MVKINLGSGPVSAKGWRNYDWGLLPILGKYRLTSICIKLGILPKAYDWKWPKIHLVDIRQGLPDSDKSVDYIYCSHVLEHFEKDEAVKILQECRRVLKNKGRLRIVLPDLNILVKNYKEAESFNREFFGFDKDLYIGMMGKISRIFIRSHQWMYDVKTGSNLLKQAGFTEVKVCAFRKGLVPDLDSLDHQQHKEISFYLEAGGKN